MEFVLRTIILLVSVLSIIFNTILNVIRPRQKPTYPPIRNKLLTKSVGELLLELRQKKLTSTQLVTAYIERIKQVNSSLNAVIEDRYVEALNEAKHADQLISKSTDDQMMILFARYPLLGIPFTVKESCGLKGNSFVVGNIHRKSVTCTQNSDVVEHLRSAGCIPLLVSANPEFCLSFETTTHMNGRCLNPYDQGRTTAGSSGGEGALNGSGASLFGLGSDFSGSIRLPALYCGVFGHKPTGNLVSCQGHFPHSSIDKEFPKLLSLGPITRFARDLPILLQIMAGSEAEKLKFSEGVQTKDIKIHYAFGFHGLNAIFHPPTAFDIKLSIIRAVKCFEKGGLTTKEVQLKNFQNTMEMCLAGILDIKGIPSILTQSVTTKPKTISLAMEMLRGLIGHSVYTKETVFMELMHSLHAFIPKENIQKYLKEAEVLKTELIELLGKDGVLFFPTFHTPATFFNMSILNMVGLDMMLLFNVLGFPATHIPMGLDRRGLPVGFQVIAAPYQDKLCLQIAAELEGAFGGWEPPLRNEIEN